MIKYCPILGIETRIIRVRIGLIGPQIRPLQKLYFGNSKDSLSSLRLKRPFKIMKEFLKIQMPFFALNELLKMPF